jgi:acyl-CoA synthetase (AMP-forming)/AMP-acid ligase II
MSASNPAFSGIAMRPLDIPDVPLPHFVLAQARSRGAMPALIEADSGRRVSYAALADAVTAAARWLARTGVCPGDVVGLCAPNGIEFVIAWYAASSAGAVVTAVNPVLPAEELVSHFRRTGTHWLITTEALFTTKLAAVARQIPAIVGRFVFGASSEVQGAQRFDALRFAELSVGAPGSGDHASSASPGISSDDVALLASSSGTTGKPKIVVLTHRSLVANLCQIARAQLVTDRDVCIALAPLFHVYGLQATLNSALLRGATVVILPRFEFGGFLRAIQDYRVTRVELVPPVAVLLAKSELVDSFDLSSLRLVTSAAAPLSADVARSCAKRLGVRFVQAFGMTEVAGGTHVGLEEGPEHPGSVGPPLAGVQCRVVDPETGRDCRAGEPGELLVRTPSMMRGYLGDAEATAAVIDADGWLHTGDICLVDAEGWYRITDRIKELIKYKGYQVAPAELEDVLLGHSAVSDVAVVRSPDEAAGEVPKAFVVRKPGTEAVAAEELMAWVADRVAPYKRVRRVEFTEAIPKSAAGKILRRQLVEQEYRLTQSRG